VKAPPELVRATETRYVQIPAADMLPCPQPTEQPNPTNRDLLAHDRGEKDAATCDENQLAKVRAASGQTVKAKDSAAPYRTPPTSRR